MKSFKRRYIYIFIILLSFGVAEGCKSSYPQTSARKRTIKKGKPIPCPLKDC